ALLDGALEVPDVAFGLHADLPLPGLAVFPDDPLHPLEEAVLEEMVDVALDPAHDVERALQVLALRNPPERRLLRPLRQGVEVLLGRRGVETPRPLRIAGGGVEHKLLRLGVTLELPRSKDG